MKDIFEESWTYRFMVMLSLCILLVYTYITNEETLLNYIGGKFVLDSRLIWQLGIFALLSLVLFYLLESTLDYKSQNEVIKEYMRKIQKELDAEREALGNLKSTSGNKIIEMGSFVVTISDMAKELNSVLETVPLLKTILTKTSELLGSDKCAIFTVSEDRKHLHLIDAIGYAQGEISHLDLGVNEASGMVEIAVQDGKFYSRQSLTYDYNKKHILENDKMELGYCQPIVFSGTVLAVICVGNASDKLSEEHVIKILATMANFGAVALSNTTLVEKIKEQSIRDGLTGLYNHQYFQQKMDKLLFEAIANKKPLGFIMIDLDHFKHLNDTYGHQMGDAGLQKLANLLKTESGKDAIVARYGGEEFVCVLPGVDLKQATELAQKMRSDFKNMTLEFSGTKTSCTLSAGVSAYAPENKKTVKKNELIKIADKALYKAKESGRNKVVTA